MPSEREIEEFAEKLVSGYVSLHPEKKINQDALSLYIDEVELYMEEKVTQGVLEKTRRNMVTPEWLR